MVIKIILLENKLIHVKYTNIYIQFVYLHRGSRYSCPTHSKRIEQSI